MSAPCQVACSPIDWEMESRFWTKVEHGLPPEHRPDLGPCWLWNGALSEAGYANFKVAGRTWRAHIWAYVSYVGPVPAGMEIDHVCRRRNCVRPDHLEAVTRTENVRRALPFRPSFRRKTCERGHPLDEGYVRTDTGQRMCRQCSNERRRKATGTSKYVTHCKNGHPLTGDNVYRRPDNGNRQCRACARERDKRRRRTKERSAK